MRAPAEFLVLFGHLFDTPLTNVLTNATVSFLLLLTLGERKSAVSGYYSNVENNEPGGGRQLGIRLRS